MEKASFFSTAFFERVEITAYAPGCNQAAKDLQIDSSFIAPRATLEAIAADKTRADALLVPWQRELLKL